MALRSVFIKVRYYFRHTRLLTAPGLLMNQKSLQQSVALPLHKNLYGGIGQLWMFERHKTFVRRIFLNAGNDIINIVLGGNVRIQRLFIPAWRDMTGRTIT